MRKEERLILTLDSSQIDTISECETKWDLSYNQCLRLPFADTSKMDMGTLVHSLLARYYTRRAINPSQNYLMDAHWAFEDFIASHEIQNFGFDLNEVGGFLRKRFGEYAINYPPSVDFLPIVNKGEPAVEVGFSKILFQDKLRVYIIEGRIDLLSRISNKYAWFPIFWDHKSQDKAAYFYKFTPQFKTYALATGYRYCGVNYFGLQQDSKNENVFRRQIFQMPEHLITEWKAYVINKFHRVYNFRKYGVPLDKNRGACPGTYDTHPCFFTSICDERKEKQDLVKWFNYIKVEPWQPWKHEK